MTVFRDPSLFSVPDSCFPSASGGWPIDYATGKLVFNDASYTLPNRAVRFIEQGPFELSIAVFSGDDIELASGALAPRKKVQVGRTARLSCQLNFHANASGTPWSDLHQGWIENWKALQQVAVTRTLVTRGLQSITYTPYVGATPITFNAYVLPPVLGTAAQGKGVNVGVVIQVPDPTGLP